MVAKYKKKGNQNMKIHKYKYYLFVDTISQKCLENYNKFDTNDCEGSVSWCFCHARFFPASVPPPLQGLADGADEAHLQPFNQHHLYIYTWSWPFSPAR